MQHPLEIFKFEAAAIPQIIFLTSLWSLSIMRSVFICGAFLFLLSSLLPAAVRGDHQPTSRPTYSDCSTSLSTLEEALYKTGKNKFLLNKFFYRAREEAVPYAKITYHFQDEEGQVSNSEEESCKVTYLWATGGFLLMQPPSVFTFTSLFFFHTRRRNFDLDLELPFECQSLVNTIDNETCSCANRDNNPLDLLSQQVSLQ